MGEPMLDISTDYGMEELIETIIRQWDEDTIIEFIKDIDGEVGEFDFTKRLYHHFDEIRKIDESIIIEEKEAEKYITNNEV